MVMHNPLHPGEIIRELLIEGAGLAVTNAAKQLDVDRTTLSRLLNGRSGISPDMALRLSLLLPNSDIEFWMNLQRDYDIWQLKKIAKKLKVKPIKSANEDCYEQRKSG